MALIFRAIVFDFNGVLADDEPVHLEAFRDVATREGLTLSDADYYSNYLHFNDRDLFRTFFRNHGRNLSENAVKELTDRKSERYYALLDGRSVLFDGAVEAVRDLASRYPLAIASGARRGEIQHILRLGGIEDCFPTVVAAEDVQRGKPDPEAFLTAVRQLESLHGRLDPSACLAIEDSAGGIQAAKSAKLKCLAVEHSCTQDQLAGADWVIPHIRVLRDWMRQETPE